MNPDMGPSDLCKILGKSVAGSLIKRAGILILDGIAMMSKILLRTISLIIVEHFKPSHLHGNSQE